MIRDKEPAVVASGPAPRAPATPAWIIDARAAQVLEANGPGWEVLGVRRPAGEAQPHVLGLDTAMPALRTLRALRPVSSPGHAGTIPLTFWAGARTVTLDCRVRALDAEGRFQITAVAPVRADGADAPPAVALRHATAKAVPDGTPADPQLIAKVAHELRTPLSAIASFADIMRHERLGPLPSARYRAYAQDIYESARHSLNVVDDMLGAALDQGRMRLVFAELDVARIVESCLALTRPLAEQAGIALDARPAPRLPHVIADERCVRQMLINLMSNAVKHTRPGDQITVETRYVVDGPVLVTVADTGPGMPKAAAAEPAGPRLRADGRAGGFGLPLTRALAEANGAQLAIESQPARGTRATIAFGKERVVPV